MIKNIFTILCLLIVSSYAGIGTGSFGGGTVPGGGANLASPGPIGATTPSTGSFTSLESRTGSNYAVQIESNSNVPRIAFFSNGNYVGGFETSGTALQLKSYVDGFINFGSSSFSQILSVNTNTQAVIFSGLLASRNGEADQTLQINSKYVDDSNYSRLSIKATDTGIMFDSEAAGTGTARDFSFNRSVTDTYKRFGSGSPQGAVVAPVGAFYSRTDGGAGTSFYVKESGTGNTGWVAK